MACLIFLSGSAAINRKPIRGRDREFVMENTMTRFSLGLTATALLAGPFGSAHGFTVLFEDFEDATVTYTTNENDDLTDIVNYDYFGRIDSGGIDTTPTPGGSVTLGNLQGTGYYGAQDTNDANSGSVFQLELYFYDLSITGLTGLSFSIFVAEDDSTSEAWDSDTSMVVQYRIDSSLEGDFQNLFAVQAETGTDVNPNTNEIPRVDTNFDTFGDGTEITDDFAQFTETIAGTGDELDIRITLLNLTSGNEDIAIDNVRVEGVVPEPGSLALLGLGGLMVARRRSKA